MRSAITVLLLVCSGWALAEERPADGLYRLGADEQAPVVTTQDGQELQLGDRLALKIIDSDLYALDNANSRFSLSLTVPYAASITPSSHILMLAGTAFRQGGSGSSQQQTSSLDFRISGQETAAQMAAFLGATVRHRHHPGHRLLVGFTADRSEFHPGEDVTATLRITNLGREDLAFMQGGRNRGPRDNQYRFIARRHGTPVDDLGTDHHFGGLSIRVTLEPGEVFTDTISLSKWFAFAEPGRYAIHGAYRLEFLDPGAEEWQTIWVDYVAADFEVMIAAPALTD